MTPRLTIVLPLRGRHLFTLRFLWHANEARLPYRFVVADGQVHPVLAEILDNARTHFPQLDIEYLRYPDDTGFERYYQKMLDALQHVRTPYVMLADNDDFLVSSGIEHSLDFLEQHHDYVCCGGGIAGFAVYSPLDDPYGGLFGPLNQLTYRYAPYDRSRDFNASSVTERLVTGLRNSWSYYAVFRTEPLVTIWRELVEMNPSDLQLVEKYCAMRTLTFGKAKSDPSGIGYMRQYYTSLRSAFAVDWVHHLLRNRFSSDLAAMIERISRLATDADRTDQAQVAETLRDSIAPWLRDFLRLNYGLSGTTRQFVRERWPGVLMYLKKRRRYSVGLDRRRMFARLRRDGASAEQLNQFRAELDRVEQVVRDAPFRRFVEPFIAPLSGA